MYYRAKTYIWRKVLKFKFLTLFFLLLILPGCASNTFFDINDSMRTPTLLKDQQEMVDTINSYFSSEFLWSYHIVNNRYCAISEHKFKEGEACKIVFCELESDPGNIHILFMSKEDSSFEVFGEIISVSKDINRIFLKDATGESKGEILISKNNSDEDEVYRVEQSEGHLNIVKIKNSVVKSKNINKRGN